MASQAQASPGAVRRFGVAASRLHRAVPDGGLLDWAAACAASIRELGLRLHTCCAGRVATGTTGQRLNEMAWSRGWPSDRPWVHRYLSGPLGGDAQIAELVLDRRCDKVLFFEDPHVARQHEADIQLLDRAVCTVSRHASCANSPAMARRWAAAAAALARP